MAMASHHDRLPSSSEQHYSSPECSAVRQCNDILTTAVQDSILSFSSKCFSKGLISEDIHDYTLTNNSDLDKASRLIRCVHRRIKNDSSQFDVLVEVLQSDRCFETTVNALLESRGKSYWQCPLHPELLAMQLFLSCRGPCFRCSGA